nr:imidazole glycerol phosphate synthase subunit HisH [uncultured Sediminibacterium sp.]
MIAIVNYGMGNLGSILNMFKKIGADAKITDDPQAIRLADKIVMPGVGSFDRAMEQINKSGLRNVLDKEALETSKPILGICLGMQLLTRRSDEGHSPGLGWINAETLRFPVMEGLRVPHMGWNEVKITDHNPLTINLLPNSRFYFVHSYRVKVVDAVDNMMTCHYGIEFDAAIHHKNIFGVQFHPEKSHKYGMQLFKNFVEMP